MDFDEININQLTESENANQLIESEDTNQLLDKDSNKCSYEKIIELLGLNININYPLKIIQMGIIELHTKVETQYLNANRYSKNLLFRKDNISIKLEGILFNNFFRSFSQIQLYRVLLRQYRHFKYNKIINVVDKKEQKKDIMGFNYDNPRWVQLDSILI